MKGIANLTGNSMTLISYLSDDEYDEIYEHISEIATFKQFNQQISNLWTIIEDLQVAALELDKNKIPRLVGELMSNFRAFLDYWKTHFTRTYGRSSNELKRLNLLIENEYKSSFAYRFLYELRNFIQHEEFPDLALKVQDIRGEKHCTLQFDRLQLLSKKHDWKLVKTDLVCDSCESDFFQILPVFMKSICRINNFALIQLNLRKLMDSCRELLTFRNLCEIDKRLAIVILPSNYPESLEGTMTTTDFPFAMIDYIKEGIKK